MVQLHDEFESIDAARNAIIAYVLDQGESFKTVAKMRYIIKCKDTARGFEMECLGKRLSRVEIGLIFGW
jgi:hypothetical protein